MSSVNKVIIIGNLGADPEVRYTQSNTAVATLSVATTEKFKNKNGEMQGKTQWHRVIAWGRLAEIVEKYLKKGSHVYFEGQVEYRKWEDKKGNDRYTTEIKAYSVQFLDKKGEGESAGAGSAGSDNPPNIEDDDIPF